MRYVAIKLPGGCAVHTMRLYDVSANNTGGRSHPETESGKGNIYV